MLRTFCFEDVQVFCLGDFWLEAPLEEDLDKAPVALFFNRFTVDLVDGPFLSEFMISFLTWFSNFIWSLSLDFLLFFESLLTPGEPFVAFFYFECFLHIVSSDILVISVDLLISSKFSKFKSASTLSIWSAS